MLKNLAPTLRHLCGQFTVTKPGPTETQVAIEGVDENFETVLSGGKFSTQVGVLFLLRALFISQSLCPQSFQGRDQHPQIVILGVAIDVQQETWIQRSHVKVQHLVKDAGFKTLRNSPFEPSCGLRFGQRTLRAKIFLQKDHLDPGPRPPQQNLLQGHWENSGLRDVSWKQDGRDTFGLPQIILQVRAELLPILRKRLGDLVSRQVGPLLFSAQAKVEGQIL